jgi:transcriptional regulator with XRE-family HTH domain
MDNIKDLLAEEFKDKEARRQYAVDFLNSHIALQIKTLRQQRGWSQVQLAKLARKHQSQISAMESVDFSAWKISTLQKLAEAFDLALTVNFESFGGFLDYLTAIDREALERPSFKEDPAFNAPGATASQTRTMDNVLNFPGKTQVLELRTSASGAGTHG